ncbi:histidine--tRNA ligase [Hyphomicrobium sp. DY-1]|uniref:histidine--tRNA ligase n=1 Tax=Hyphomicrobium sp. DY-1 TaxID=3075650 RepID=UPI0039C43265
MSKANISKRPKARLAKGFRDIEAPELKALNDMIAKIRDVYERYGFEALETPAIEYTDALGKFLPDQDRPNAGVFSFQDEDEQWMSLRYDLTAPLARYVAQNFQTLPKPFRRYAFGNVYRNEKPGPGRFRQFMQFDADTVGAKSVAADAELCMLAADTLEALGLKGKYVIKVNSRKVLDGMLETVGVDLADDTRRLAVLRSLDKLDKFSKDDVALLLGPGRKDESGDFTKGAGLKKEQIDALLDFVSQPALEQNGPGLAAKRTGGFEPSQLYIDGLADLSELKRFVEKAGYEGKIRVPDYSVVRGLEYYTGPVFEAELTFEIKGDDGKPVRFGSVGGGGRYDDLIARFTGQQVAATGFSIGVSRLQAALSLINESKIQALGPVVVLVMDKDADSVAGYQKMTQALRNAGIRAEMYLGNAKSFGDQIKYADKRNSPCVIIQGSDERAKGEVTIKDLIEGAKAAAAIKDNKEWKETRPAQFSVSESRLVQEVHNIIKRHQE